MNYDPSLITATCHLFFEKTSFSKNMLCFVCDFDLFPKVRCFFSSVDWFMYTSVMHSASRHVFVNITKSDLSFLSPWFYERPTVVFSSIY